MSSPSYSTVASAPIFVVSGNFPGSSQLQKLAFAELGGIESSISIEQYISVDNGYVNHSKQFGLTTPPSVTLKRGLDNSGVLWNWHQLALQGNPAARADQLNLQIFGGGLPSINGQTPFVSYTLVNAWCAKISISQAKAGEGIVTEDVTIACDLITLDSD